MCIVLVAVLVPVTITAHWAHYTFFNSDRYVATMAPLAQDRAFTNELARQITDALFDAAPSQLRSLLLAGTVRNSVQSSLAHQMAAPSFQAVWDRANRQAQHAAVEVFTGTGAGGATGSLVVNLTPVAVTELRSVQTPALLPFVPQLSQLIGHHQLTVTLLTAQQLREGRQWFSRIVQSEWLLGGIALALLVVALVVSLRRWRLVLGAALCTVVTTALAVALLSAIRSQVVADATSHHANQIVSAKVFDILDRYLRMNLTVTLVVAAVIAVGVGASALLRGARRRPV